jgi:hypothetical protein
MRIIGGKLVSTCTKGKTFRLLGSPVMGNAPLKELDEAMQGNWEKKCNSRYQKWQISCILV